MLEKYRLYDIKRIGYFDIEVSNLDPEFGNIITIALLIRDVSEKDRIVKLLTYKITKKDIEKSKKLRNVNFDKRILKQFLIDLNKEKIDLLIGHYSNGWGKLDMPFIRGRAYLCNLDKYLPQYKKIRFGDTWKISHMILKSHSYRLDSIGVITNSKIKKTIIKEYEWKLAIFGDKKAIDYVMDHNIKDVKLTYQVHKKLENFYPIPSSYI